MVAGAKGIPLKLFSARIIPIAKRNSTIPGRDRAWAFAPRWRWAGFSTVWGAAMLPYRDADMDDWPIKNMDLEKHYRAVAEIAGLAAQRDEFGGTVSVALRPSAAIPPSRQAESAFKQLQRHRAGLRERGWHLAARVLAVRAADNAGGIGCVYCGLCMYGCPYGCIYTSADTVQRIARGRKNSRINAMSLSPALREDSGKVIFRAIIAGRVSRFHLKQTACIWRPA